MTRERDTQKQRIYRAEWPLWEQAGQTDTSLRAIQAFADRVCNSLSFRRRFGRHAVTCELQRGAGGHAWTGARHIIIGLNASGPGPHKMVILHELAHTLGTSGEAAHGPAFARRLLTLVRLELGEELEQRLRDEYARQRVKLAPPVPLRSPEATPAAHTSQPDRVWRIVYQRRGQPDQLETVHAPTFGQALDAAHHLAPQDCIGVKMWQGREPKAQPLPKAATRAQPRRSQTAASVSQRPPSV